MCWTSIRTDECSLSACQVPVGTTCSRTLISSLSYPFIGPWSAYVERSVAVNRTPVRFYDPWRMSPLTGNLTVLMPPHREPIELPVLEDLRPPRADAARNAARILDACERLFSERGVENVSMDEIAAEAGVGKGTLFRRFGDRAGLARAVLSERARRFQEEMIRGAPPLGPGAPARDRLIAFATGLAELLDLDGELVRVAEATAPHDDAIYRFYRTHVELLVREADPQADAEFIADALLGMLTARVFLYMRIAQGMPLARIIEGWTDVVRRLLPEPESSPQQLD